MIWTKAEEDATKQQKMQDGVNMGFGVCQK